MVWRRWQSESSVVLYRVPRFRSADGHKFTRQNNLVSVRINTSKEMDKRYQGKVTVKLVITVFDMSDVSDYVHDNQETSFSNDWGQDWVLINIRIFINTVKVEDFLKLYTTPVSLIKPKPSNSILVFNNTDFSRYIL